MAYFAELDLNNFVIRVISINNDDIIDETGHESEDLGIAICIQVCGPGKYKQTSRNTVSGVHYDPDTWKPDGGVPFRHNFGEIGYLYNEELDCFLPPPPQPWYEVDENFEWVCPPHLGPKTGQPFTHEELLYIGHLINTNTVYSIVPLVPVNDDPLANICSSTEFGLADITEITHGSNPHTWFYLDDRGEFNIDYQDDYWIELDLSPIAVITAFSMKHDNEKSNTVSKFCYEQHPQNEAFSLHECFRMILEWDFAYSELGNREPMAELAHQVASILQIPENVKADLINGVDTQVVGQYLSGGDIYQPFYRTEKTNPPSSFVEWFESIKPNFPPRSPGDPLNVQVES